MRLGGWAHAEGAVVRLRSIDEASHCLCQVLVGSQFSLFKPHNLLALPAIDTMKETRGVKQEAEGEMLFQGRL